MVSLLFSLAWHATGQPAELKQRLASTSTGIGLMRKEKDVLRSHFAICVFSYLRCCIYIAIYMQNLILDGVPEAFQASVAHKYAYLVSLGATSAIALLALPVSYSLVSAAVCTCVAELCVLTDDLGTDDNTFQVAVTKHYMSAHWRLQEMAEHFRGRCGAWNSALITLCSAEVIITVDTWLTDHHLTVLQRLVCLFIVVDATCIVALHCGLSTALHGAVQRFRHVSVSVLASERPIQGEVYSMLGAYCESVRSLNHRLSLFRLYSIDVYFFVKWCMLCAVGCYVLTRT